MFLFLVVGSSILFLFINLDKKLLLLLSVEILFLSLIMTYLVMDSHSYKSSLVMFVFCSLMVMDSVFGLSLLICCGRSSSKSFLARSLF